MSKNLVKATGTFVKNAFYHAGLLMRREESAREALEGIGRDARKLKRLTAGPEEYKRRKRALKLADQGRRCYNVKDYRSAEEFLRRAIELSPKCGLAHLYLGHTMYKSGKHNEAQACWRRAAVEDPDSDAAATAREKLQHIERKKKETVDRLEEDVNGRL